MPQAKIKVNGVIGSNTDFTAGALCQLDNQNVGGESTFNWTIVDQPKGAADSLSNPTIQNPTFTASKEGTYVVKLVVNQGQGTEASDTQVVSVKQLKTRLRVPGATEQGQADPTEGWAAAVNAGLQMIDAIRADPGFVVGSAGAAGLQRGAICQVTDGQVILVGLPGQQTVPKFTRAMATSASNVRGLLGILISDVNGSTTPANGALCYFRIFGLIGNFTGAPSVGDPVFVNDSGDFSLTEGTFRRLVGFVAYVTGGAYAIWYDGRLLDPNPEYNSVDLPNGGVTAVAPAARARLRGDGAGGQAQASENGSAFTGIALHTRAAPDLLGWGNTESVAAPGTNYLDPGFGVRVTSTNEVKRPIIADGVLSKLRVRARVGPTGDKITFTLRKNGVDTAVTCDLAAAATTASDLTNSVSVSAGDDVSIKAVAAAGITVKAEDIVVSLKFTLA